MRLANMTDLSGYSRSQLGSTFAGPASGSPGTFIRCGRPEAYGSDAVLLARSAVDAARTAASRAEHAIMEITAASPGTPPPGDHLDDDRPALGAGGLHMGLGVSGPLGRGRLARAGVGLRQSRWREDAGGIRRPPSGWLAAAPAGSSTRARVLPDPVRWTDRHRARKPTQVDSCTAAQTSRFPRRDRPRTLASPPRSPTGLLPCSLAGPHGGCFTPSLEGPVQGRLGGRRSPSTTFRHIAPTCDRPGPRRRRIVVRWLKPRLWRSKSAAWAPAARNATTSVSPGTATRRTQADQDLTWAGQEGRRGGCGARRVGEDGRARRPEGAKRERACPEEGIPA